MFGIGLNEMVLILVLAVVIIGPKQLPEVARTMGKLMAQFKRASNDLRDAVNSEFLNEDGFRELRDVHRDLNKNMNEFRHDAERYIEREVDRELEEEKHLAQDAKAELEAHSKPAVDDLTALSSDTWTADSERPDEPPAQGGEPPEAQQDIRGDLVGSYLPDGEYYGMERPHVAEPAQEPSPSSDAETVSSAEDESQSVASDDHEEDDAEDGITTTKRASTS